MVQSSSHKATAVRGGRTGLHGSRATVIATKIQQIGKFAWKYPSEKSIPPGILPQSQYIAGICWSSGFANSDAAMRLIRPPKPCLQVPHSASNPRVSLDFPEFHVGIRDAPTLDRFNSGNSRQSRTSRWICKPHSALYYATQRTGAVPQRRFPRTCFSPDLTRPPEV